jgi:hypothetical protein
VYFSITMKTKPILTLAGAIALICGIMLFNQCKSAVNDKDGINSFLSLFDMQVKGGQTGALLKNFDMPQKRGVVTQLLNMLCNKTGMQKNSKPNFKLELNTSDNDLATISGDITKATFSVKLTRDTLNIPLKTTTLSFKIKKVANSVFKIVDVDATQLLKDYVDFDNLVRSRILSDKDIYSPETLAAFKVAEGLKGKYDTIPWFQHMGDKTFYFVVKGKMNVDQVFGSYRHKDTVATYKMGLVDLDQKEIIPVDFDLVHNIGATYPNLIEVEKDKKRGFYNLQGQAVLPAEYDQIFPLNDNDNLAVLRKGDDYYWWKNDYTVSDKDADLKITDLLPRIQAYGRSANLGESIMKNVTEQNSREDHGSVYLAPSYMVDWALLPAVQNFKNPLRRNVEYENASQLYELKFEGKNEETNWLASAFYSIKDNYLGGREGLYIHKNVLVINKKNNRIYGHDISTDRSEGEGGAEFTAKCSINSLRTINDSLYEIKTGTAFSIMLRNGSSMTGGPGYNYLTLKNDKLFELKNERYFGFTKYVKMDDSYLNDCYEITDDKGSSKNTGINTELLRYMKNEIYGEYHYKFKDSVLLETFQGQFQYDNDKTNDNVDDSLTVIDKYNIAFINKKLQQGGFKNKVPALIKNKATAAL